MAGPEDNDGAHEFCRGGLGVVSGGDNGLGLDTQLDLESVQNIALVYLVVYLCWSARLC